MCHNPASLISRLQRRVTDQSVIVAGGGKVVRADSLVSKISRLWWVCLTPRIFVGVTPQVIRVDWLLLAYLLDKGVRVISWLPPWTLPASLGAPTVTTPLTLY